MDEIGDKTRREIIQEYLSTPEGRKKLADSMVVRPRGPRRDYPFVGMAGPQDYQEYILKFLESYGRKPMFEVSIQDWKFLKFEEIFKKMEDLWQTVKCILVSPGDVEDVVKALAGKEFTRESVKAQRECGIEGYWFSTDLVKTQHCKDGEILFLSENSVGWARIRLEPED